MSDASFAPLRARAPAKINLGLFVGPPRPDGRHELASVMQSISLCDELTLSPAAGKADRKSTRLNSSHIQKSRMPSSA